MFGEDFSSGLQFGDQFGKWRDMFIAFEDTSFDICDICDFSHQIPYFCIGIVCMAIDPFSIFDEATYEMELDDSVGG